jgi:hypothetical protein
MFPNFLLSLRGRFDAKRGRSISPLVSFLRSSCQIFALPIMLFFVAMKALRGGENYRFSLPPVLSPPVHKNPARPTPAPRSRSQNGSHRSLVRPPEEAIKTSCLARPGLLVLAM